MQNTDTRQDAQVNPQNDLARAIDLERELTEQDYATNSDALKKCVAAWEIVRRGRP